jgi:DnaK suppressor protein
VHREIWLLRVVFSEAGQSGVVGRRKEEMIKSEINKFKKILETKQAELEKIVRNRDAIAIEKSADALDEVQHASERELAIRNLDRESNLLRSVRLALRRIEDGSFGTCLHCEEDISPKRVAAVPWAANCIQCQELADRNKQEGNEAFDDELVSNAA